MLTSIAIVLGLGWILGEIAQRCKLPRLVGYLLAGILIGTSGFNLLDSSMQLISADLRQIALVIILAKAGLTLKVHDLKEIGRPALLMSFVPALVEIIAVTLMAPIFLPLTRLEAMLLGSVLAAVSPAVVVPRMVKLIDEGKGQNHKVPQLILAGASVDDVVVIVIFSSVLALCSGGQTSWIQLAFVPISVLLGAGLGWLTAKMMNLFLSKFQLDANTKFILFFSACLFLLQIESWLKPFVVISGLLAIMSCGIFLKQENPSLAQTLAQKFQSCWGIAEIFLFVLVGAIVQVQYAFKAGIGVIVVILLALLLRVLIGVQLCLIKTKLSKKEKYFCMISYIPKATVQAAIGGVAYSMGLPCGELILIVAVVAILITAPLGATLMDTLADKWLD